MEQLEDVESDDVKVVAASVDTALQCLDVSVIHTKNMLDDYGQKWFHTLEQFETNRLFPRARNPELESIAAGQDIFNTFNRQVNAYGQLATYKNACIKLVPNPVTQPKTDWRSGRVVSKTKPKTQHAPEQLAAEAPALPQAGRGNGGGLTHPQLPPSRQLPSSHERLTTLKCSFCTGKKEYPLVSEAPRSPSSTVRSYLPYRASKNSLSHASPKCAHHWFPGKGTRNITPQVSGLFYTQSCRPSLPGGKPLNT
jgi:hypothetical protein